MLKKNLYNIVRLRPMAKFHSLDQFGQSQIQYKDHDWTIRSIQEEEIEIINNATNHVATLGYDHIHQYTTDPARSKHDDRKHGFLLLHVQIHIEDRSLRIEPIQNI